MRVKRVHCIIMLTDNRVGADGAEALAPVIGELRNLQELYLHGENYEKCNIVFGIECTRVM